MYEQYKFAGDRLTFKKIMKILKYNHFYLLSTRIWGKQKCFLTPSSKNIENKISMQNITVIKRMKGRWNDLLHLPLT